MSNLVADRDQDEGNAASRARATTAVEKTFRDRIEGLAGANGRLHDEDGVVLNLGGASAIDFIDAIDEHAAASVQGSKSCLRIL